MDGNKKQADKKPRQACEPGTVLFAKRMGFYSGQRIRKGQRFTFDGKVVPLWAVPADSPEAKLDPDPPPADTRPIAAQKASKKKSVVEGA